MYVKWSADYLPSIKLEINDKIKLWAKSNKINLNKQYFIIFPDKINNNSEDYFNWTLQEFKSFNQMMSMKDIQVIVMADKIGSYSSLIPTLKFSMYDSLALMSKAACVIARDIDILCFAAVFCSGSVIATRKLNYNSFYRRASLLGVSDKVLELKAVTPYAVFSKYFSKLA